MSLPCCVEPTQGKMLLAIMPSILSAFVFAGLALWGYMWNSRRKLLQDRLDRLNKRLLDAYYPIIAVRDAMRRSIEHWRIRHNTTERAMIINPGKLDPGVFTSWLYWMEYVQQPLNAELEALCIASYDLFFDLYEKNSNTLQLRSERYKVAVGDYLMHIGEYRSIIAYWKKNDLYNNAHLSFDAASQTLSLIKIDTKKLEADRIMLERIPNHMVVANCPFPVDFDKFLLEEVSRLETTRSLLMDKLSNGLSPLIPWWKEPARSD